MSKKTVLSTITGSLLAATALLAGTGVQAAEAVKDPGWYFFGEIEAGGRFFLNNPEKRGLASSNQTSLGKYYEYQSIKPGPFGSLWLDLGTKNGLWNYNLWADNVGYDDQRYELNASKAGEYYFSFDWDQTPHVYSTNAKTLYSGLGGNYLSLPPGLAATLNTLCGNTGNNTACANQTAAQTAINNSLQTIDLGIRRDTAQTEFRWTPNSSWDVNVAYSNTHRFGSQVDGAVFGASTGLATAQVPKPVNDTTQNYAATGEYIGTSPWGQLLTIKAGYAGSTYTDKWNSYTVEDPFCPAGGVGQGGSGLNLCGPAAAGTNGGNNYAPSALMSLWPDNSANGFNLTLGADLPAKSRYMGTLSYTMMRQNQGFLPFTNNPAPLLNAANPFPTLPAASLNGKINTLLSNNVVTTQLTPDLKSKVSYRYYNFDNQTPELLFNDFILTDSTSANNRTTAYAPVRSISVSYTKQNAGAELDWRPDKRWNIGGGYGYERYDWTRADAAATNENQGKLFVDYKPWLWVTSRLTAQFADRQSENYDYRGNVGTFQWADPTCQNAQCGSQYSAAYRQFYLDNRQRTILKYSVAIDLLRGLTVTPTIGYQNDDYRIGAQEAGLTRSTGARAGVEVAYAFDPYTTFLFSYMAEEYRQNLKYTNATPPLMSTANVYHADVHDTVHTFMGAANWTAIPNKLDLRLTYTLSLSKDSQPQYTDGGVSPTFQYPDVIGQWQRFEATAKYTFDKEWVRSFGINGEAFAKLRYAWERNSVNNVDQDLITPYILSTAGIAGLQRMTWMAYDNPNYNVHLLGASFGVRW